MIMPFGKFKGCYVSELPIPYLEWLTDNINLREPLRTAVFDALEISTDSIQPVEPNKVKRIYRDLALKYHPDRGGDTTAMQAINEFYERLAG